MRLPAVLLLVFSPFLFAAAQQPERKMIFEVQLNAGSVLNTDKPESFAYGGALRLLIPFGSRDYITAGAKAVTCPFYGGVHFWPLKKGFDHREDALNYTMELVGYRINVSNDEMGFLYAEPRVGLAFANGFRWAGFAMSPAFGFQTKKWDLALFFDGAFGNNELNTGKKGFRVPGISAGLIF